MANPQTVPDLFQQSKTEWLDGARAVAIRLLRKSKHVITIEDVLAEYKFPKYLHRNTIGSVFNDDHFVSVGFTRSRRSVSNGRVIQQWSLSDKYAADSEVDCE
ncbi:MAG: hypothetical protein EOO17_00840 [Chloroflexi bacterium]|nr:MAG: hypothetical protein EOO17_00840 [Chloroflexota bacterium]